MNISLYAMIIFELGVTSPDQSRLVIVRYGSYHLARERILWGVKPIGYLELAMVNSLPSLSFPLLLDDGEDGTSTDFQVGVWDWLRLPSLRIEDSGV